MTRRSKTAPGDPRVLLVAYAVKAKMRMMMSSMKVWTQSVRKVALIPPNMVYIMTPNGSKKQAAGVGIPDTVHGDPTTDWRGHVAWPGSVD